MKTLNTLARDVGIRVRAFDRWLCSGSPFNRKPLEIEDDFCFFDDATTKQRTAVFEKAESSFNHSIRSDQDRDWLRMICANVDQHKPQDAVTLILALQKDTAETLDYTMPAIRNICKTHGMSALLPTRLKMILINNQRLKPTVRAWIRCQQGLERKEKADQSYTETQIESESGKAKEVPGSAVAFRDYYSQKLERSIKDNDLEAIKFWDKLFTGLDESIRRTNNQETKKNDRKLAFEQLKRVLKKGTVREDGMLFWSYSKTYVNSNFEWWVTVEKFNELIEKDKNRYEQNKNRYEQNNPPSERLAELRKKKKELPQLEFDQWKKSTRPSEIKKKTDPVEIQKGRDSAKRNYARIKSDPVALAAYKKRKQKTAKKRYHKIKDDPKEIIERSLRSRLGKRIRSIGTKFTISYCEMLGCTPDEAQKHIEKQFTKKMSWENYASYWEIDHIRPLASFNLEILEEALAGNHYTNLQPLSKKENNKKSDKWNGQTTMFSQIL